MENSCEWFWVDKHKPTLPVCPTQKIIRFPKPWFSLLARLPPSIFLALPCTFHKEMACLWCTIYLFQFSMVTPLSLSPVTLRNLFQFWHPCSTPSPRPQSKARTLSVHIPLMDPNATHCCKHHSQAQWSWSISSDLIKHSITPIPNVTHKSWFSLHQSFGPHVTTTLPLHRQVRNIAIPSPTLNHITI